MSIDWNKDLGQYLTIYRPVRRFRRIIRTQHAWSDLVNRVLDGIHHAGGALDWMAEHLLVARIPICYAAGFRLPSCACNVLVGRQV